MRENDRLVERCQNLDRKNIEENISYRIEIVELKEEIKKCENWMEESKNKYE